MYAEVRPFRFEDLSQFREWPYLGIMHLGRSVVAMLVLLGGGSALLVACSDDAPPPLVGKDSGGFDVSAPPPVPCEPPSEGCPCGDDAGAQLFCGIIYRQTGTHVDCAKGYMTCGADGKWGACEGPAIFQQTD
jgi:hypothetical protein